MDLTIARQNLHRGLNSVGATVPVRSSLPVLANVLFETEADADDGKELVWVTATDLDIAVRVTIRANVRQAGAITAPSRRLNELARQLPDEVVDMKARGTQLELKCGPSEVRLHGMASEEFPSFPTVDYDEGWSVSEPDLRDLIDSVAFAVSKEEARPILGGVYWHIEDGRMTMVATNGHRLARRTIPVRGEADGRTAEFIVPPEALNRARRLFDGDGELTVARTDNHLGFRSGGLRSERKEICTRLIDGKYPNYEQVIPKDNDRIARVEVEAMLAAVRRMSVIASEATRRVKLFFEEDRVRFEATNADVGEARDRLELAADYQGEPLQIAFNANYLLDMFQRMPRSGEVEFTFKSSERAATVTPVQTGLGEPGSDSGDPDGDAGGDEARDRGDYLCLIMPLRLVD